jgi:hypothetical protein
MERLRRLRLVPPAEFGFGGGLKSLPGAAAWAGSTAGSVPNSAGGCRSNSLGAGTNRTPCVQLPVPPASVVLAFQPEPTTAPATALAHATATATRNADNPSCHISLSYKALRQSAVGRPPTSSPATVPSSAFQKELLCLKTFCMMVAPTAAPMVAPSREPGGQRRIE